MHGSIRNRLEDLLAAKAPAAGDKGLAQHLAACTECASEVRTMRSQKEMLELLRTPEEIEPAPGFYARVLQRIEDSPVRSIWLVLVESPFGKGLAFASLTLAIVLGSYVVTAEARDGHLQMNRMVVAQDVHFDAPVTGDQDQQRDAVLENIAAHQR